MISKDTTFLGYRRENGRVGVRNHVIILPVDDISNAAAEAVGNNIKGTLALPHPYGRLQFGADLDLHFRTLIGTGAKPPRVVRYVGWRKCMRCGQLFWSDDVQRLRLCSAQAGRQGCRSRQDDDGI